MYLISIILYLHRILISLFWIVQSVGPSNLLVGKLLPLSFSSFFVIDLGPILRFIRLQSFRDQCLSSLNGDGFIKTIVLLINLIEDFTSPSMLDFIQLKQGLILFLCFNVIFHALEMIFNLGEGPARDTNEEVIHDIPIISIESHSTWCLVHRQFNNASIELFLTLLHNNGLLLLFILQSLSFFDKICLS